MEFLRELVIAKDVDRNISSEIIRDAISISVGVNHTIGARIVITANR